MTVFGGLFVVVAIATGLSWEGVKVVIALFLLLVVWAFFNRK